MASIKNIYTQFKSGFAAAINNVTETVDSHRTASARGGRKMANFNSFQKAWSSYKNLMEQFMTDQAAQRLDSIGPEFEEFFEVNPGDDSDEQVGNPFKPPQLTNMKEGSLDSYRRDSTAPPNQRSQTMDDQVKERAFLDKKIKPELQEIIKNLEIEERGKTNQSQPGECLQYFMEEKMLSEILGQSMANRPHGLLFLTLKLSMYIIRHVKSFDVLTLSENHQALFQVLQFIYNSMKNEMLEINKPEKKIIIDFLLQLTIKITYESPEVAECLLADQTSQSRKEQKYDYVPLQIILFMLLMEDNKDDGKNVIALRKTLLLMLKQSVLNPKIKDYVLAESELPIILVAKLAHFYSYLPEQLSLIKNSNVSELYPVDDQEACYHNLDLLTQIKQSFSQEMIRAHSEFVKYACFLNLVAETLQVEPKLSNQLQVCLFNYFLIDIMQPRLLSNDMAKQRTALQYFEQLLNIFQCSDLVQCLFFFMTGLPQKTKEEDLLESDELDVSDYQSRLSMSIDGNILQIGRKMTSADSDGSRKVSFVGGERNSRHSGGENGLLSHFHMKMNMINLQQRNRETSLALRGPQPQKESFTNGLNDIMSPTKRANNAKDVIMDQKKDNLINLLDSVLRRNKEGNDDDDVLYGDDDIEDVRTEAFDYNTSAMKRGRVDYYFNRQDHQLTKIFYLMARPEDEEKAILVVLKIIDGFLAKNIPKIADFFIFNSLKKVLQRTDWLKPASEQVEMAAIGDLNRKFIQKFPSVAKGAQVKQLASSFGKVDLQYYINNENMITGDPKENFDSRKTKIKDENFQSLYDQLVQEWWQSEQLEAFDNVIIESPKNTSRKMRQSRLRLLQEPENIDDEDCSELPDLSMQNKGMVRQVSLSQGPQVYRFDDLADLIVDKRKDLEFDDLDEEDFEEDEDSIMMSTSQLPGLGGNRLRREDSRGSSRRMSQGDLIPGIKVRTAEEMLNYIPQKDIVSEDQETADPIVYAAQGGLFKFLKEKLATFMLNEPEVNLMLCSILTRLSSFPVKLDILDGQFNSTTSPFDKTHANLTMLHMVMFDQPLTFDKLDVFSILSTLTSVNTRVEDFCADKNMALIIEMARKDGNLKDLTIPTLHNAWLSNAFKKVKIQVFNALIFKELLLSLTACLRAKELVSDMLDGYEEACAEDTALEASFTVFGKKKQLNYSNNQQQQGSGSQRGSKQSMDQLASSHFRQSDQDRQISHFGTPSNRSHHDQSSGDMSQSSGQLSSGLNSALRPGVPLLGFPAPSGTKLSARGSAKVSSRYE